MCSACDKAQMARIEADRAAIMAERNSGDRVATGDPVDRAYMKRQKMTYVEYKYSRTVQHLSCYMLH